ncbi:uncharacterized protein LOC129226824 [Uloborus diversus]|uniref:uncharacterized protein LOC129226824 n=1 Tax=Uloborus diversus TaxID=327109 RepID=UPI00240A6EA2|nr:uncharacterized protein LOC129226824 [Uloborus diversus]
MPKIFNLTERLIPLVRSHPEVWDQSNSGYTCKDLKLLAWQEIGGILGISGTLAKTRWTNLRDLFRRELKKMVRMAHESGDPDAYRPRWKPFRTMMFLRDQMLKDEPYDDSFTLYPQTILEDGHHFRLGEEFYMDETSTHSSDPKQMELTILPEPCPLKRPIDREEEIPKPAKKPPGPRISMVESLQDSICKDESTSTDENLENSSFFEVDEDYLFLLSLVPSVRRIRKERKTQFRMKLLQLIANEEQLELPELNKKFRNSSVQDSGNLTELQGRNLKEETESPSNNPADDS